MNKSNFLLALGFLLLMACQNNHSVEGADKSSEPQELPMSASPLFLGTELFRNFQPMASSDGQPLVAVLTITSTLPDSSSYLNGIKVQSIKIVFGSKIWEPKEWETRYPIGVQVGLEIVARNGPKWGPNVDVDVFVVGSSPDGTPFTIEARKQNIGRVE